MEIALKQRESDEYTLTIEASNRGFSIQLVLNDKPAVLYHLITQSKNIRHFRSMKTVVQFLRKCEVDIAQLTHISKASFIDRDPKK